MTDSSAALLDRARSGDRGALEELLLRHQSHIYRFSMKMCRDPQDAQDVLQDTMLAMARGIRDFRGESSVSTWLYKVARSYCIKKRRRGKFAPARERSLETEVAPDSAALAAAAAAPDEVLAAKEVEQALERAISSLEPGYREVLVLRDIEGLTAPEVAEVMGISVQAVKSRLHRARLSVRAEVAPLLGVPNLEEVASAATAASTAATPTVATAASTAATPTVPTPAATATTMPILSATTTAPGSAGSSAEPGAAEVSPCPDVLMLFSRHLEDEISAEACANMERHVHACPRCTMACDSLKRTLALCRTSAPTVEVPASLQASIKVALRDFLADQE